MRRFRIDVAPGAYLLWAILLMVLPLRWLLACTAAAAIHELFHILAIRILGGQVWDIRIDAGGARIDTAPMEAGRELVCALAGPLGALIVLPFFRWIPCTAICVVLQSAYNLLPLYPLDGGRALRCGLRLILGDETARRIQDWLEKGLLACLLALGIYGTAVLKLGLFPVIGAVYLTGKGLLRKIPCKSGT